MVKLEKLQPVMISMYSGGFTSDPIVSGFIGFSGQPGLIATDDGTSWKSIENSAAAILPPSLSWLIYEMCLREVLSVLCHPTIFPLSRIL